MGEAVGKRSVTGGDLRVGFTGTPIRVAAEAVVPNGGADSSDQTEPGVQTGSEPFRQPVS